MSKGQEPRWRAHFPHMKDRGAKRYAGTWMELKRAGHMPSLHDMILAAVVMAGDQLVAASSFSTPRGPSSLSG